MKSNPIVVHEGTSRADILKIMKDKVVSQLPVINNQGSLVGLELLSELIKDEAIDNWVVLMAGGLGSRLKPLTDDCPKPMVKVGGKPVLETILESFIEQGFHKFYFSVNHLKEHITGYFGDGSKWGATIKYLAENEKMGTAGALSLLPDIPTQPVIVMNGDLLTKLNYKQLLNYHREHDALATMCVREYSFQIPYGVVRLDESSIIDIDEKPTQSFFVNAGVYVLEPEILRLVPKNKHFDMTTLFEKIIEDGMKTTVFPIREYWIDIGYHEDFARANSEYGEVFIDD